MATLGRRYGTGGRRHRSGPVPAAEWVRSVAERVDLPAAAVRCLARRAGRDPDEFLDAWRAKTPADCDRFWSALTPDADDDLLRAMAALAQAAAHGVRLRTS